MTTNIKLKWEEISRFTEAHKYYWVRFESLKFLLGTLFHKWEDIQANFQTILPQSLKDFVLKQLHNSITGGHLGVRKRLSKIRDKYFRYHMSRDVKDFSQKCDNCQSRKTPNTLSRAPLQTYVMGAPMERLASDIMGPLPLIKKRNSYLLVVGDYFTKWIDAFPIRNQKAQTIVRIVIDRFIPVFPSPYGNPLRPRYTLRVRIIQEICDIIGIVKTYTTPYRPQPDGVIECANRTIENILSAFVNDKQ